jgi:hypothetical protein
LRPRRCCLVTWGKFWAWRPTKLTACEVIGLSSKSPARDASSAQPAKRRALNVANGDTRELPKQIEARRQRSLRAMNKLQSLFVASVDAVSFAFPSSGQLRFASCVQRRGIDMHVPSSNGSSACGFNLGVGNAEFTLRCSIVIAADPIAVSKYPGMAVRDPFAIALLCADRTGHPADVRVAGCSRCGTEERAVPPYAACRSLK